MPSVWKARIADACASASSISTPGITGRCGKWPTKKGSLTVTFFNARMRLPASTSSTRSTSRNG
jgi:hypothetical protein